MEGSNNQDTEVKDYYELQLDGEYMRHYEIDSLTGAREDIYNRYTADPPVYVASYSLDDYSLEDFLNIPLDNDGEIVSFYPLFAKRSVHKINRKRDEKGDITVGSDGRSYYNYYYNYYREVTYYLNFGFTLYSKHQIKKRGRDEDYVGHPTSFIEISCNSGYLVGYTKTRQSTHYDRWETRERSNIDGTWENRSPEEGRDYLNFELKVIDNKQYVLERVFSSSYRRHGGNTSYGIIYEISTEGYEHHFAREYSIGNSFMNYNSETNLFIPVGDYLLSHRGWKRY